MPRPPRSWRPRLLGSFRTGQDRPADLGNDPQRLVLYLPGFALDEALRQSIRAGAKDLQRYCESVLLRQIEAEQNRNRVRRVEAERGKLEGLRAVSSDLDYLAELSLLQRPGPPAADPNPAPDAPQAGPINSNDPSRLTPLLSIVERHAGLIPDPASSSLTACLSSNSLPSRSSLAELAAALEGLQPHLINDNPLARPVAFALHRLALVAQVFITGSWYGSNLDPTLVASLGWIQETVDHILSGRPIRYDDSDWTGSGGAD